MIQRTFLISNKSGLHIRPASLLAGGIGRFQSRITIRFGENDYNAKSVINVLSACIKQGDRIEVSAQGDDEAQAMEEVARLIESGLGE